MAHVGPLVRVSGGAKATEARDRDIMRLQSLSTPEKSRWDGFGKL